MISKIENILFYLLILFLPTQLGKHFWPDFAIVSGIRVDYLSPTIYFTDILIFFLSSIWVINYFQKTRKTQKSSSIRLSDNLKVRISGIQSFLSIPKIYLLFIFFLFLNILFSHNLLNGFYHLLKLLEFSFVGFYIATKINTLKKFKKIFLFLAISVIFESLVAIAQFINQGSIGGLFYFLGERTFNASTPGIANASINGELLLRPYGTLPHPNVLAGFLLCVMILSLWSFKESKKYFEKIIFSFSVLIGTVALILTMSRVAIVLWTLILVAFFVFLRTEDRGRKRESRIQWVFNIPFFRSQLSVFSILSSLLFIILLFVTPFGTRLLSTNFTEEAVTQRQELIASSFKLFSKNPIIGIGPGNFMPLLPSVQKPLSSTLYIQPVHNIFLLVLVETGIIGFSFFIWFLIKTYKYLLSNLKTHFRFLIALTAILILGFFDHYFLTLQQGQLLSALILGLSWISFAHRA